MCVIRFKKEKCNGEIVCEVSGSSLITRLPRVIRSLPPISSSSSSIFPLPKSPNPQHSQGHPRTHRCKSITTVLTLCPSPRQKCISPILSKSQHQKSPKSIFSESLICQQEGYTNASPAHCPSKNTPERRAAVTLAKVVFYSHRVEQRMFISHNGRVEANVELKVAAAIEIRQVHLVSPNGVAILSLNVS